MNRIALLVLVPVLLAGCSDGDGGGSLKDNGSVTATGPVSAQVAEVGMTDELIFKPNIVNAKVGTLTLTVKNLGGVGHNLEFDDAALGKTSTISGRASTPLKVVFGNAGTFTFTCTFHPGMDGKVVVS